MSKFVTQKLHAYIDYPVALGLIAAPFVLGIGMDNAIAFALSIATGIAALLLTALTDHETGLLPVLPYKFHLAVDALVGAAFVAAPFLFGFTGLDMAYYLVIGSTVLAVVGLHKGDDVIVAHPAE
ncbi:hypothetical protein [uncultured Tateyamaria sp.]|uniref:SPW repeat domain-containing protein n=1 Tax=uncultured Tateyamaria sp. TaxID=455651 RepID=UPI00262DE939|nr:hypothetical protein [uncultured Tateyamaria sp.]